jgi:hypothetical protein
MKRRSHLCSAIALTTFGCLTPPPKTAVSQGSAAVETPQDNGSSATYRWKSVQILGGGFVSGVIFSQQRKDLVYARTDIGGAYRYSPKDESWLSISDQWGRDQANYWGIESFALDPTNPNRLYLACGTYTQDWAGQAAMLRSNDQGKTFDVFPTPFKMGGNEDGRSNGERLSVDPNDPKVIWFGSRKNGLWKSTNEAESFGPVGSFTAPNDDWGVGITFVTIDGKSGTPGAPSPVLYVGAATPEASVWVSRDGGSTFQVLGGQPKGLIASHGELDGKGALYVTYGDHPGPNNVKSGAVYRFELDKKTATDITPAAPSKDDAFGYGGLALDAQHPGTLLVSTIDRWTVGDEIFRSTDSGHTWKSAGKNADWTDGGAKYLYWGKSELKTPHWMGDIDIDPFNSDRAMVVNGAGIWATTNVTAVDSGKRPEWRFFNKELEETSVGVVVAPTEGAQLLSGVGDICGFYHANVDQPPAQGAYSNPGCNGTTGIDYAANAPKVVVRVGRTWGKGEMHGAVSKDGGISWRAFATEPSGANTGGMVAMSADGKSILWTFKGAPSMVSFDQGTRWELPEGLPPAAKLADWANFDVQPAADRVNPSKIYVLSATKGQVFVSRDQGKHFVATASGLPQQPEWALMTSSIRTVSGREGDVWITTGKAVYRSTDSGESFDTVGSVDEGYAVGFGKAAPGKPYPAIYLLGMVSGEKGAYRSVDEGKSWERISDDQHRFGFANLIEGDQRTFGRVYIGTPGRGILYGDPRAK